MMMKQQMPFPSEENMSSLSYYSAAAPSGEASSITHLSPPPPKKKRNLPGNPDPDAEVIGLSPKSLMATNRFICEICNKGFQRDQNLQLHKRGHNLPWKLKQRESINNDEVKKKKKKVYVCPVITCVHHHPSRALGDLTGIKKHFYRKHGEKKWKCLKCSKLYAVQSDWKAHSKTCGTREYKCYCGTIFSRRDSFITHRAFCDALAEENSRSNPQAPSSNNNNNNIQSQSQQFFNGELMLVKREESMNPRAEIPPWLGRSGPQLIYDHHQDELASTLVFHDQTQNPNPKTSATALLQKAAQMGAYSGNYNSNLNLLSRDQVLSYSSLAADIHTLPPPPPPSFFQEMILMSSGFDDDDDDAFSSSYDMLDYKKLQDAPTYFTHNHYPSNNYEVENNKNNNVGMSTRDFFGTKPAIL